MRDFFLLTVVVASSCGRTDPSWPEPPLTTEVTTPEVDAGPERADRFVGLWMVDQPYHAGYEATFYALSADGQLRVVDSFGVGYGPNPGQFLTGVVAPSFQSSLQCVFGSTWRSAEAKRLFITGDCTDGTGREIELSFESPASQNAAPEGATVSLISVGGEPGWLHPDFDWRFKKCRPGPPMVGTCEG